MDLGIEGFKNYELLKGITIVAILKNGQINAFYETIKFGPKKALYCHF